MTCEAVSRIVAPTTIDVTLEGFHSVRRAGIVVGGADRVNIGALTVTVGSASETVTVTAVSPLIQTQSGERSFSISAEAVQAIAVNGRAYNTLTALAPGVVAGTVNGLRANQNTLQIDGITSVDTGNNGNAVTLSVDAVQEVKVLTSSYQAEYGRSAGAQISAVTKSGTKKHEPVCRRPAGPGASPARDRRQRRSQPGGALQPVRPCPRRRSGAGRVFLCRASGSDGRAESSGRQHPALSLDARSRRSPDPGAMTTVVRSGRPSYDSGVQFVTIR